MTVGICACSVKGEEGKRGCGVYSLRCNQHGGEGGSLIVSIMIKCEQLLFVCVCLCDCVWAGKGEERGEEKGH